MESNRRIHMVATAIERQGRYLITKRRDLEVLPGLWEFPSAATGPGESDEVALKREIRERLGVDVEGIRKMAHRIHEYVGYDVDLVVYRACLVSGQEPRPLRVAEFRWVSAEELEDYPCPSADQSTTDLLLGFGAGRPGSAASPSTSPGAP
jgi:8-oxo-dGTP diphosphatase